MSVIESIVTEDLRVVPIIAIDFSMGNLTFGRDVNLHQPNTNKQNDYRDLMQMIALSYSNVTNLPIFGYAAKTSNFSQKGAPIFPLSRYIRNPFTSNDDETIDNVYQNVLEKIEMSLPVNLKPIL